VLAISVVSYQKVVANRSGLLTIHRP